MIVTLTSNLTSAGEVYKQAKVNGSSNVRQANTATVEDEIDDGFAGPELPSDLDEAGGDEEGRFFGGGVDRRTAQAIEFVEELEKEGDAVSLPRLRRMQTP